MSLFRVESMPIASAISTYLSHSSGVQASRPSDLHLVANAIHSLANPIYSRYSSSSSFPVSWWLEILKSSKMAALAACHRSGLAATLCTASSVSLVSANQTRSASSPSMLDAV